MGDDWDLHAVVRGCATTTTTTTTTATTWLTDGHSVPNFETLQDDIFMCFPDLFQQDRENIEELHDLYKPFFPKSQPLSPENMPISPLSVLGGLQDLSYQTPLQINEPFAVTRCTNRNSQSTPKLKRRKNQLKRVCQVPAEGLSSDMWSWRKYGQKPIKGSPYPRGYYRCSTSKGCLARKQVERNRSDPAMFIVTYTGEHNHPMPTHRNSLAGSTRQKPVTSGETNKPTCSSPATTNSPATVDEDEEFGVSGMVVNDDFFTGLEEFCS